jgi:hypothetical protein
LVCHPLAKCQETPRLPLGYPELGKKSVTTGPSISSAGGVAGEGHWSRVGTAEIGAGGELRTHAVKASINIGKASLIFIPGPFGDLGLISLHALDIVGGVPLGFGAGGAVVDFGLPVGLLFGRKAGPSRVSLRRADLDLHGEQGNADHQGSDQPLSHPTACECKRGAHAALLRLP